MRCAGTVAASVRIHCNNDGWCGNVPRSPAFDHGAIHWCLRRIRQEVAMRAGYAPFGIVGTIILIVLILWLLGVF
jgi:hypothetical protein